MNRPSVRTSALLAGAMLLATMGTSGAVVPFVLDDLLAALPLALPALPGVPGAPPAPLPRPWDPGYVTAAAPYVVLAGTTQGSVKPLLSTNDVLPNGFRMGSIPDGLGMVLSNGKVEVLMSHEYNSASAPFVHAQVSQLTLNPFTGSVLEGKVAIGDAGGYERFCSSSAVEGFGFEHPIYLANEEVDDGIVVALDTATGAVHELPWLGEFAHENTIHVPLFFATQQKVVFLGFEDGAATESEVYLYVADSAADFLAGGGQLYVLGATDAAVAQWDDLSFGDAPVEARFIPLDWDWQTQDEVDLDTEAIAKGGFQFIRPEDGAVDKRPTHANVVYFADTGNDKDEAGVPLPPGENGQGWIRGRMYQLTFPDPLDFTKATFEVILDGDDPDAPGYQVMSNPDNIDTSLLSLMIQEDRIGPTRTPVTQPYDVTKNAKVLRYDLLTGALTVVAYNDQSLVPTVIHGNWEASGILDASAVFGPGAWLLDVQAHSFEPYGPAGQLLLMSVPGS